MKRESHFYRSFSYHHFRLCFSIYRCLKRNRTQIYHFRIITTIFVSVRSTTIINNHHRRSKRNYNFIFRFIIVFLPPIPSTKTRNNSIVSSSFSMYYFVNSPTNIITFAKEEKNISIAGLSPFFIWIVVYHHANYFVKFLSLVGNCYHSLCFTILSHHYNYHLFRVVAEWNFIIQILLWTFSNSDNHHHSSPINRRNSNHCVTQIQLQHNNLHFYNNHSSTLKFLEKSCESE